MKRVLTLPSIVALALTIFCAGHVNAQAGGKKMMRGSDTSFVGKNIKDNMMEIRMSKMALEKSSNQEIKDLAQLMIDDHSQMLADLRAYKQGRSGMGDDSAGISRPGDTATASNELDVAGRESSQMQPDSARMDDDQHDMAGHDRKNKMKGDKMKGDKTKMKEGKWKGDKMGGELMSASGAEFDSKWVDHMLKAHEAKLSELNSASATLTDPQLKTIVSSAIPKVQNHIERLRSLKQNTSTSGS